MLIKKKLKTEQFVPCSTMLKLKKQPFPLLNYPTCKKQNKVNPYPFDTPGLQKLFLSPKIERTLLETLPFQLNTKRQDQKKKKILRFLYPINFFNFQRKGELSESSTSSYMGSVNPRGVQKNVDVAVFTQLNNTRKDNTIYVPFAQPLKFRLKIILKTYNSQLKDVEVSITAMSKLVHYLENCCTKQLKTFLTNPFYFASFGQYPSFFNLKKTKNLNTYSNPYPGASSTFSLLENFKTNATQLPLNLNLLIEQPLIDVLRKPRPFMKESAPNPTFLTNQQVKRQTKKDQPAFLLSTLQKKNYCNRYFFKSSAFLNNNGPINKLMQKTFRSAQSFTVIRSPFVFKKTREQFMKQQFSYLVTVKLHSPIQKQLFIECLSLLRLPVELEIHC